MLKLNITNNSFYITSVQHFFKEKNCTLINILTFQATVNIKEKTSVSLKKCLTVFTTFR